jgi:hypothetical protein
VIARLKAVFKQAPLLASAFAIALCLTLWFGGQTVMRAIYWGDPRHQNQEIAGWMTIGYVGRSWQVPKEELVAALTGIVPPDKPGRLPTIDRLAQETGLSEADIIARLQAAIDAHHAKPVDQE